MEPSQEPPRRRRRAARRAAGPPAPTAAPTDSDSVNAATSPSPDDTSVSVPASIAEPAAVADPDVSGPAVSHTRTSHGSPGDAPGHHHPGPPTHGAGSGHGPQPPATAGHERPAGSGDARRSGRSSREDAAERSLRSLVTTRTTQVTPTAALRAREVALPSAEDLAAADDELVLVRRHYVPPTALTSGRRQDWPGRRAGGQSRSTGKAQ